MYSWNGTIKLLLSVFQALLEHVSLSLYGRGPFGSLPDSIPTVKWKSCTNHTSKVFDGNK